MKHSATRLMRLFGLTFLCLVATGTAQSYTGEQQCDAAVCAPFTINCVDNCNCSGALACCQQKCTTCCSFSV